MTTVAESAPPRKTRDGSLGDLAPTASRGDGVGRRGDFGGFALSLIVIEAFAFSDELLLQAAPLLDQNKERVLGKNEARFCRTLAEAVKQRSPRRQGCCKVRQNHKPN